MKLDNIRDNKVFIVKNWYHRHLLQWELVSGEYVTRYSLPFRTIKELKEYISEWNAQTVYLNKPYF